MMNLKFRISGSTQNRLKMTSFTFRVVRCRIRLFPTLISRIKWLGSGLPLTMKVLEFVEIEFMFINNIKTCKNIKTISCGTINTFCFFDTLVKCKIINWNFDGFSFFELSNNVAHLEIFMKFAKNYFALLTSSQSNASGWSKL